MLSSTIPPYLETKVAVVAQQDRLRRLVLLKHKAAMEDIVVIAGRGEAPDFYVCLRKRLTAKRGVSRCKGILQKPDQSRNISERQ